MFLKIVTCLGLIATVLAGVGCNGVSVDGSSGRYRTISMEPRRDTEAAARANKAGLNHLADGDLDKAADAFNRALTADVEFGPAHNNLGKVYYQRRDWHKAAWEFEYARKLLPRHGEPRNNLGLVLEEAGELDRAVEQYRAAVDLGTGNTAYRANLARALIRRGDQTDEVRALLDHILEHDTRPEWLIWASQRQAAFGPTAD